MGNFINEKVLPYIFKFVNLKSVQALKSGVLTTLPLTIVGSILLLLCNLPIESAKEFITNSGLKDIFLQGYYATFAILSIVATIGIAYNYAKLNGQEPLGAGIIALVLFILLMSNSVITSEGVIVNDVISKEWTSAKGMISSIIVGLFVGKFYSYLLARGLFIKMPEGVPEGVSKSFASLIPSAIIIIVGMIIFAIFKNIFSTTMLEWIYKVIQMPLQNVTDSLGGIIVIAFTVPFLWFFGVHGATIVSSIANPILISNAEINNRILQQGLELTVENGGKIVTVQFYDFFINLSGTGITLGLVMYLVAFAKSKQCKEIGKLALIPGLFNINEPVLFGLPVVMNPILVVPFIFMPIISGIILYFSQYLGFVPLFDSVMLPWTTPPIISGFLMGGFKLAFLQIIILTISFFVYLPFIRKIDNTNLKLENQQI